MKKEEIRFCECCGAKMVSYTHSLNKGLCKGLIVLDRQGGASKLNDMSELNFNQKTNFQKLKFWGLVQKGSNGVWSITTTGLEFLYGRITVNERVVTYRNVTEKFEGEMVSIEEAMKDFGYWWREQYLENAVNKD